ncbi:acetyltransferase [Vallitalea longa]|uniref:Acetyltransferase n=1 Tax=Vallitalea longa TaxID=2936439 RepID=A0A9W5YDX0_9FIRM|nr:GNAT family protein [Vallitalea longa]GKX30891.1 acetyltransferase [Vallitalea longa]
MLIQHEDIVIRNAELKDSKILCEWWNNGEIMAHAGFPHGLETTEEKIKNDLKNDSDETRRRLIIEYNIEPIGEMSYRYIGCNTAEMGIKICDVTRQNKGLGTIILKLFITSLFDEYNVKKIVLDTNLNNKRAQHVYEKIGFKQVKTNYDSWKNQLGELQSFIYYELSKEHFVNLNTFYKNF